MPFSKSLFHAAVLISGFLSSPFIMAADLSAGKAKTQMCAGCHGPDGISNNSQFPILAGQQATYLVNQLNRFKSGERKSTIMNSMAKQLSDEDIINLAGYLSSQKGKSAGGDQTLAKTGADKASMCMGCHGKAGQGNGQFPKIGGQHPDYLIKQLTNFKNGDRRGGPMNAIARNLNDDDVKVLAHYFGSRTSDE